MTSVARQQESKKRPRNRRGEIAEAAARLFCELGYHRVAVNDIAGAVGITARAIYRHFANKHDLLAAVVFDSVDRLEEAVGTELDATMDSLASLSLEHRHMGVLIQRESRHLDARERRDVRLRTDGVVDRTADLLRAERPELDPDDAELLVRSALAVFASASYHTVVVGRAAGERLLHDMAAVVFRTELVSRPAESAGGRHTPPVGGPPRASRREAVLAAAIELLGQRGYAGVRMEDVGAAAGISGPSIYEHFGGKADLLMAALTRGAEWLQLGLSGALTPAHPVADALERVLRSYVDFTLEHTDLMSVFLSETINLPDDERHALRRLQHEYTSEWVRLVLDLRPELNTAEARFVTHGALGLVNDYIQGGKRSRRPDLGDVLIRLGMEVMAA